MLVRLRVVMSDSRFSVDIIGAACFTGFSARQPPHLQALLKHPEPIARCNSLIVNAGSMKTYEFTLPPIRSRCKTKHPKVTPTHRFELNMLIRLRIVASDPRVSVAIIGAALLYGLVGATTSSSTCSTKTS